MNHGGSDKRDAFGPKGADVGQAGAVPPWLKDLKNPNFFHKNYFERGFEKDLSESRRVDRSFVMARAIDNVYQDVTRDIRVEVVPVYVPEQTHFVNQHLYTYNISITNLSSNACQLLRRHWVIVDGHGKKEEVDGDGVIGQQPLLQPGENFQYSSFCPLSTPTGSMRGHFEFVDHNKERFLVRVPLFFLRPDALH